nr:immunoglobulin heavy chain junction region [Macaca mulatta]MOW80818.1 immunoglobulin heavy chain junction region [Macaca mulatta]MOW83750.1 immunoglobulin heavy chain junction region [Macaca mulatta]MOW83911.1 immunoglobulin heavy chain junction region [Macaca mulatta]MOW85338.1 immunoglobulin heavy chain junction region [Macaca mulatta]
CTRVEFEHDDGYYYVGKTFDYW